MADPIRKLPAEAMVYIVSRKCPFVYHFGQLIHLADKTTTGPGWYFEDGQDNFGGPFGTEDQAVIEFNKYIQAL